jgi:hypothetical protein
MIILNDLECDTIFIDPNTSQKYLKGSMAKGFGIDGKTLCYPSFGGKFQTNDKFKTMLPNKMEVLVTAN